MTFWGKSFRHSFSVPLSLVWAASLSSLFPHKQKAEKGAPRPPEAEPEEQEEHQGQWWDWPQPGGLGQRTPDLQHASSRFAGH